VRVLEPGPENADSDLADDYLMSHRDKDKVQEQFDSSELTDQLASKSNLVFYFKTFLSHPGMVLRGIWESIHEICLFIFRPRFPVTFGAIDRLRLIWQFVVAELNVSGTTTVLETIWLAYACNLAPADNHSWVEVGCFKGLSSVRLSLLCKYAGSRLHVFDTFAGLPTGDEVYHSVDGGMSVHFQPGSYRGTEEEVRENVTKYGDLSRVSLTKGDVKSAMGNSGLEDISFCFLDVDLVESYKSCFTHLAHRLCPGAIVVIHEASYAPIRALVLSNSYWKELGIPAPQVTFIADRFKLRLCRHLAFLQW
jgi:hypothetical protein